MKMNKLKRLLIAACCISTALWAETQGADNKYEEERLKNIRLIEKKINSAARYLLESNLNENHEMIFKSCFGEPEKIILVYEKDGYIFGHHHTHFNYKVNDKEYELFKTSYDYVKHFGIDKSKIKNKDIVFKCIKKIYYATIGNSIEYSFSSDDSGFADAERFLDTYQKQKVKINSSKIRIFTKGEKSFLDYFSNKLKNDKDKNLKICVDTLAHEISHAVVGTSDYLIKYGGEYGAKDIITGNWVDLQNCANKEIFYPPNPSTRLDGYNTEQFALKEDGWPIRAYENASNWGCFFSYIISSLEKSQPLEYIKRISDNPYFYKILFDDKPLYIENKQNVNENIMAASGLNSLAYVCNTLSDAYIFKTTKDITQSASIDVDFEGHLNDDIRDQLSKSYNLFLSYRGITGAVKLYDNLLTWRVKKENDDCFSMKSLLDDQYIGLWDNEPYVRASMKNDPSSKKIRFERVSTLPPVRIKNKNQYIAGQSKHIKTEYNFSNNELLKMTEDKNDASIFLPIHVTDKLVSFKILYGSAKKIEEMYKNYAHPDSLWLNCRDWTGAVKTYDYPLVFLIEKVSEKKIRMKSIAFNQYMGLWGNEPYIRNSMGGDPSSSEFSLEPVEFFNF